MPQTRPSRQSHTTGQPTANPALPWMAGTLLVAFVVFCYWPLTRFYLAQDDFILLEFAKRGFRAAMETSFTTRPGQFRPLTKGAYFLLTWPSFGLNPFPYHLVSILIHAINAVLVGVVLRRMGVTTVVSWAIALLFAAHMGHLEAVAWASCVQQMIGGTFTFLTLIFGLDALAARNRGAGVLAAVAYALALGSYEQSMAAPFVLLVWQWTRGGFRSMLRASVRPLAPMFVMLAAYILYAFAVRGMPDSGPYVMSVGKNVLQNLKQYTGFTFAFWLIYPQFGLPQGLTPSHIGWLLLLLAHGVMGTFRQLAFGCAAFLMFFAPVMLTSEHTHSFHFYVPAIAVMFLLGSAADGLRNLAGVRRYRIADAVVVAVAAVVAAGAVGAMQRNVHATYSEQINLPRSFVLRRAVLAERMCQGIRARWTGTGRGRLWLVYPGVQHAANWRNVQSALGEGSAVRLLLRDPELDVVFAPPAPMPVSGDFGELIVYSEVGDCYTVEEYRALAEQRGLLKEPSEPEAVPEKE